MVVLLVGFQLTLGTAQALPPAWWGECQFQGNCKLGALGTQDPVAEGITCVHVEWENERYQPLIWDLGIIDFDWLWVPLPNPESTWLYVYPGMCMTFVEEISPIPIR